MIWESRFALPAGVLVAFVLPWLVGWLGTIHLAVPVGPLARAALGVPMGLASICILGAPALLLLAPELGAYAVLASLIGIAAVGIIGLRRGGAAASRRPGPSDPVELGLAIACFLLVAALALPALAWPPSRTEALARWAVKGRHLAAFGVDAGYLGYAAGEGYPHPEDPPLLPIQMAWIGLAFGGWSEGGIRIWPLHLLLAFAAFTAAYLRERGVPGRIAWLLVALFAASPGLVPAAIEPEPDLPTGVLAALSVALLHARWGTPDPRGGLCAGVMAGLMGLASTEGLAAVPVVLAVALAAAWSARADAGRARAALGAFVLPAVLLPVAWVAFAWSRGIAPWPPTATDPLTPGSVAPASARILGSFLHHGLFSGSATGSPDDWMLLLPTLAVVIAARWDSFRTQRSWLFVAAAAGLLATHVVALLSGPEPLEWLLETRVRGLTLQLAPLLLVALGTCFAPPEARGVAPSGEWPSR